MAINNFYYNHQLHNYIVQFMAIFSGLQVQAGKGEDGTRKMISVPIHYGSKDRVTAAMIADNTQNSPIRLPVMSAYLNNIDLAPDRRHGTGTTYKKPYLPRGEVFPEGVKIAEEYMPVPYNTSMELAIYTSNMDQHFQILEQILIFFDPLLQIQKSDGFFDHAKITTVELTGMRFDENYPIGTDRRMIMTTLDFFLPIWFQAPVDLKNNFVADVYARIAAVTAADGSSGSISTSEEAIAALDDVTTDYSHITSINFDFDV